MLCGTFSVPEHHSQASDLIGPQPWQPAVTKKGLFRREKCYGIRMSQFELRALKTLLENTLSETQFQVFFTFRAGRSELGDGACVQISWGAQRQKIFWLSQLLIMLIYHAFQNNNDLQQLLPLVCLQSCSEIIHHLCGYFLYDIFVYVCVH